MLSIFLVLLWFREYGSCTVSPYLFITVVSALPTGLRRQWVPAGLSDICFFNCYFQDPTNLDKFNVSNFFHVKNNIKVIDPGKSELKVG